MSYQRIYRGEFKNTLPGADNVAADQVVRIDINDTTTGSTNTSMVGTVVALTTTALNMTPPLISPVVSLAERTAFWQTYVDFFHVGMLLRVSGTPTTDGDYIVIEITPVAPTNAFPDNPGSIGMVLNVSVGTGDIGVEDVTFEDVSQPVIIPLDMDGDPLHISVIDDNEDKFTPIRGKQAEIKVHTNSVIDIDTFCEGDDERFLVEIFVDDLIIFRGFLIIPDMEQDFLPDPNVLKLSATDNLGTLKDQSMVDDDNVYPIGKFKLIQFISWALKRTGIIQNINVVNNLKHGSGQLVSDVVFAIDGDNFEILTPATDFFYENQKIRITGTASNDGEYTVRGTGLNVVQITLVTEAVVSETALGVLFEDISSEGHFYDTIYLDAKTFEKQISLGEDFYSMLLKILGEDSVLFQCKGEWWIIRIDEIENFDGIFQMDVATFDADGEYESNAIRVFTKAIGINDSMWMSDDDAVVIPDRALKFVKETYKYETASEIICNIDFSRGDFIEDLTPTDDEILDGALTAKSFEIDGWTLMRGYPEGPDSPITNDSEAYIERLYNVVDYESARFAVITSPSAVNIATPYILSCPLPVKKLDRFESSVNFKFPTNSTSGGGGAPMFQFALKGKDGSWWLLTIAEADNGFDTDPTAPRWLNTQLWTVETSLADYGLNFEIGIDFSKWQFLSYDFKKVPPIPIDGNLYILLHGLNFSPGASYDKDVHWSNLSFTYYPYINGSYQKYTGQYHMISQDNKNKAARDNQVYMSDSPRIGFKGAMLLPSLTDFVLANFFTDHNHLTPRPYGEIQAYAVWNQYRNSARNYDCNIDLLDSETTESAVYNGVDLIHKIDLNDTDKNTINRYFLILHYEQDFNMLAMKCFIASLFRTDIGKVYSDPHEFKFISE